MQVIQKILNFLLITNNWHVYIRFIYLGGKKKNQTTEHTRAHKSISSEKGSFQIWKFLCAWKLVCFFHFCLLV